MERLYWGILGAGKISHDFVNALNDPNLPAQEHNKVVAVAARSHDRAQAFADNHGIMTVYSSYEQLAADDNINIIYIGNTIAHHYEACTMMLNANKHVLCEKSLTWNAAKSKELYDLAKEKKLFLMEALWSNFVPSYKFVKQQIAQGAIGDVKHVEASFGLSIMEVPRLAQRDLGGGACLDLGIYVVNVALQVFGREKPVEIVARGNVYPTGVDSSWDVIMVYEGGRRAVLKCSAEYRLSNTVRITGTRGCIELDDPFHIPSKVKLPSGSHDFPYPQEARHKYNFENSSGLAYEAAAVADAVRSGKLECAEYTADDSLYIAATLDEIRRQLGAKFDEDEFH